MTTKYTMRFTGIKIHQMNLQETMKCRWIQLTRMNRLSKMLSCKSAFHLHFGINFRLLILYLLIHHYATTVMLVGYLLCNTVTLIPSSTKLSTCSVIINSINSFALHDGGLCSVLTLHSWCTCWLYLFNVTLPRAHVQLLRSHLSNTDTSGRVRTALSRR